MNIVLHIAGYGHPVKLTGPGPWVLGRSESADISFPEDQSCSRTQAIIHRTDIGFELESVSKVTPTMLNREVVTKKRAISQGDTIAFAQQKISASFRDERPSPDGPVKASAARSGDSLPVQSGLTIMRTDNSHGNRDSTPVLFLDHPTVSRRHARFVVDRRGTSIEDLGSTCAFQGK